MNRRVFVIFVSLLLVVVNTALISRAWDLSSHYPFDKMLLDNRLHFTVSFSHPGNIYPVRIISVDSEIVIPGTDIVSRLISDRPFVITYEENGEIHTVKSSEVFNVNLFAFLLFILLCGNIHCIWGAVIRIIFGNQYSARIFGYFSVGLGFVIIGFVHSLLYQNSVLLNIVCSIFLAVIILIPAFSLAGILRMAKFVILLSLCVIVFLTAIAGFLGDKNVLIILYSIILLSFLIVVGAINLRMKRNRKISRRTGALLVAGGVISLMLPFWAMIYALANRTQTPASFFIAITLVFPLVMVNNISRENISNSFSVRKRYFFWVVLDLAVACYASAGFYYSIESSKDYFCVAAVIAGLLVILGLRRRILQRIQTGNPIYRDHFSESIRRISEISASPRDFKDKISHIYSIIGVTTGVRYFHIELFELSIINKIEDMEGVISYSKGSALERYFIRNPSMVKRNSFFTGYIFDVLEVINPMVELMVPLKTEGYTIGVMHAGFKENGLAIADDEILFFHSLSVILYQLIENEILFKEYISKRDFEREIDIASYIQMRLFPKKIPYGKGVSVSLYSRPYLKVTGDYYEFIEIDRRRTLIAIGDVAGHGMSAATILATVGNLTSAMIRENKTIDDIMNELNHFLAVRYRGTELMTLILMIFDRDSKTCTYANAGHCGPVLCREGKILQEWFNCRNAILGADRMFRYESSTVKLQSGDEVVVYTDGLIEIQGDRLGNNIGDRILMELLEDNSMADIERKIESLSSRIEQYPKTAINDDITVIGIKVQ
jgi:serine phosphatase RsbU (regulator of sigma subunit)